MLAKAKVKYQGKMDEECIALCDAINRIPGLRTSEAAAGMGRERSRYGLRQKTWKFYPNCFTGLIFAMSAFTGTVRYRLTAE